MSDKAMGSGDGEDKNGIDPKLAGTNALAAKAEEVINKQLMPMAQKVGSSVADALQAHDEADRFINNLPQVKAVVNEDKPAVENAIRNEGGGGPAKQM